MTSTGIDRYGCCLVIDCHSFPDQPLPYEMAASGTMRPDICIGTDSFHTSEALAAAFATQFQRVGWTTRLNDPFAGALVPVRSYQRDRRVMAIMVEVNRRLYLHEGGGNKLPSFARVARLIQQACMTAAKTCRVDGKK